MIIDDIIEHFCPVCEEHFFTEEDEQCPICGWINDVVQELRPDVAIGANRISLIQFIENYKKRKPEA